MMEKIVKIRYSVKIMICLVYCGLLCGCGVRDAALVLPLEDVAEGEIAGIVQAADVTDISGEGMPQESESGSVIYVYVCGAVVKPGVVELQEGSRADAALQAAGGFTAEAKMDYVNLAAKLEDGQKLYFPTIDEAEKMEADKQAEQLGLVNINTADVTQLMTLPGIGEAKAQDIIAYREEHGAFRKKEDLKKVSGIKDNMYKKLEEKIVVQ